MTPAARVAAAIEILDEVLSGQSAEKQLTTWARTRRFAGSKDRAAIRDHVFEALRNLRSFSALGGARSGRGLMLGAARAQGIDPASLFTGEGYSPPPLSAEEAALGETDLPLAVALDCPDWLVAPLQDSLQGGFEPTMRALKQRAPVFLRVNLRKASRDEAQSALQNEGIETQPHPLSDTALEVLSNPRRVQSSLAYADGLVELQDAASQAVTDMLPLHDGQSVLDLCAGGGGKSLAMAGRANLRLHAYDVAAKRMRDLPARAERAGVHVSVLEHPEAFAPYDLVLADVPCSGSGAWRRSPEGKWALTPASLQDMLTLQYDILDRAAGLVSPDGYLAYSTCSVMQAENQDQIAHFQAAYPAWQLHAQRSLTPADGGDGFHISILKRG